MTLEALKFEVRQVLTHSPYDYEATSQILSKILQFFRETDRRDILNELVIAVDGEDWTVVDITEDFCFDVVVSYMYGHEYEDNDIAIYSPYALDNQNEVLRYIEFNILNKI